MNNLKLEIAKNAGFCFGVQRAVDMVAEALKNNKKVYCWGDLVHNPMVIKKLKKDGLKIIESLREFPEKSIFVVRSHGMTAEDLAYIKEKTFKIIDTTCPFVVKAQKCAKNLKEQGFNILIVGDKDLVEVKGIDSYADGDSLIVKNVEELRIMKAKLKGKIGVVAQTTQKNSNLQQITKELEKMGVDFVVNNTICSDATNKQAEITDIPKNTDVLIVIGGLHSSNTTKLAEIGRQKQIKTYHIETATEIDKNWFQGDENVFVTAGASTPLNELGDAKKIIRAFDF